MKIDIIPKGKDKKHHDLYKKALQYYLNQLMAKRHQARIKSITIKLVDSLDYGTSMGECKEILHEDGTFDVFFKLVSTAPLPEILSTMAHETVHLKQTVKFELMKFTRRGTDWWVWKGKKMKYSDKWYDSFTVDQQCAKLPWEKEAYDLESELVRRFFWNLLSNTY